MRLIVFFDLPVVTAQNRRSYRQFRKYLVGSGFLMLQESVYCKILPNSNSADYMIQNIKMNSPNEGIIQILKVTEKQFSKMTLIVGSKKSEILNDIKRLVIL